MLYVICCINYDPWQPLEAQSPWKPRALQTYTNVSEIKFGLAMLVPV